MKTFQNLIQNLTQFWVKQGCIYEQGHDVEVGAGTFNPSTFLRCLGPEPYSTVYIEPSRRPQDGRYGENPNRLQLFHQLQVIIKPSPLDIQKLYLESLTDAGFDLSRHDIRFVHDDWESPTLGAWGLGWEVWIDGMEVTQFTYFQSVAGHTLSPVSVEITYGLERLGMILQNIDNVYDMQWSETYTYGDIKHRNEVEWSQYNFNLASTEMWLRHFEDFENEAKRLSEEKHPIPAYDFVLKASHAFNVLEARGILSTTERALYIARIRHLSTLVANTYLANREELGFPLLKNQKVSKDKESKKENLPEVPPLKKEPFLLEIGSEELPATFVPIGLRNLESDMRALLKKHKLDFSNIHCYGTPRRLSIMVENLISSTKEEVIERRGPGSATAFDAAGNLTKQGSGFFKSLGIETITLKDVEESKTFTLKDGYIFARIEKKGESSLKILSEEIPKLIEKLSFPKSMKWADYSIHYARPLKWIVALFGKHHIPLQVGPIHSDRLSYGHSQLSPDKFPIKDARDYLSTLRKHFVIADAGERKRAIIEQLLSIENDASAKALETNKVLKEVLHLTEWPLLTAGSFSQSFLKCPKEVLVSEMVCHQKYFPLESNGSLINQFVITADNTPSDEIIKGNEKVLSARLSDGVFLYEQDLAISLDSFNDTLKNVIFQKELGSYYDKVLRMESIIEKLSTVLQLSNVDDAKKAAHYAKADLASNLVDEFPDLQGIIGKYYALNHGLSEEIALGIEEHWMPKSEGAELPSSDIGILLSLTDKLDNLIGYFSVGLKPTSSSDPHALRRQTIGIIKILIANKISMDLSTFIESEEVLDYITARAKGVFEEFGFKKDEIEASLKGKCINPYKQYCMTKSMHAFRSTKDFTALHQVYKRAKGQIQEAKSDKINETLLEDTSEINLFHALKNLEPKIKEALAQSDYSLAFTLLSSLKEPLGTLYDSVKILADDEHIRANRLALLKKVFTNFNRLLDFSKIQ